MQELTPHSDMQSTPYSTKQFIDIFDSDDTLTVIGYFIRLIYKSLFLHESLFSMILN